MSESNQNEILLSAYLDGELSADELKKVQDLIAKDAHARFLLQQWKDQRSALKSLPPARLQKDLTAGILNRLNSQATIENRTDANGQTVLFKEGNGSVRQFNWRSVFMIASSLAAILLLGLFLFPGRDFWKPDQVAVNKNPGEKSAAALGMRVDAAKPDIAAPSSPTDSASGTQSAQAENSHREMKDETSGRNHASAKVAESESGTEEKEKVVTKMPELAENTDPNTAASFSPPAMAIDKSRSENDSDPASSPSIEPSPRRTATAQSVDEGVTSDQIVNVNQVFLIEIKDPTKPPLALVSVVFSQNNISIKHDGLFAKDAPADGTAESSDQAGSIAGASGAALKEMYDKPPEGMEALFVVATRSQLRSAMRELVKHAEISGAEVLNQNDKAKFKSDEVLPGKKLEQSMEDFIAKEREELESQTNKTSKELSPASRQAMAQKIRSLNLSPNLSKKSTKPGYGAGGVGPVEKGGDGQDSQAQLIPLEELHWRFGDVAVEGIRKEVPSDSKEPGVSQIAEELVPFLLFVRNKPSD